MFVSHVRHIKEVFQLIPKGNSKSSNGGAVMVTAIVVNDRPEAEFQFIAPTIEIATIAYKQAKGTIKLDATLDKLFQVQDHLRRITHRQSGATLQIKAADTDVITGGKALGTMIDETHVFAEKARASDLFVELRGALTKRPDGFLFQTTTQSKRAPAGVFAAELEMARMVRDGKIELPLLPVLYELLDRARAATAVARAQVLAAGQSQSRALDQRDFLAREVMRADADGPAAIALMRSQHFQHDADRNVITGRWLGRRPLGFAVSRRG